MYHITSYFDVPPERHQEFIDAALEDRRDSLANEPGTKRFELIKDVENLDRFHLNEAYNDEAAFEVHKCGPYFKRFFNAIGDFAAGPTSVIKGTRVEDPARRANLTNEQLLSYYAEVCRSHEAITEFRAKLLALLPIASGTGIGLLVIADGTGRVPAGLLVALGLFGALVTVGLLFFELDQMDQCRQLRNNGIWIEKRLGIHPGQFASERGHFGLRDIWPSRYNKRERDFRKLEREGRIEAPDGLGLVNVMYADFIVYGTLFLSWIFVLAWGIKELAK